MPALSFGAITDYPFQPFTKIYSADTNAMFAAITTWANTTKLDYQNVQVHGLTRNGSSSNLSAGTANYVVYNDSSGNLTEAATMPTTKGGLGADLTPTGITQAGYGIVVNAAGTGFQLSPASSTPSVAVFSYLNFI